MKKSEKIKAFQSMAGAVLALLSLVIVIALTVTMGWFTVNLVAEARGIRLQSVPADFEFKYWIEGKLAENKGANGELLLEIDFAIPGKLYKIDVEITNKTAANGEAISYSFSIMNLLGMLYNFEMEQDPSRPEEDFYFYSTEVFRFYHIIFASNTNGESFDFEEYREILNNENHADYFESAEHRRAAFADAGRFFSAAQSAEINSDGQSITRITFFLLAEDFEHGNDDMFQRSMYQGSLSAAVNRGN